MQDDIYVVPDGKRAVLKDLVLHCWTGDGVKAIAIQAVLSGGIPIWIAQWVPPPGAAHHHEAFHIVLEPGDVLSLYCEPTTINFYLSGAVMSIAPVPD